MRILNTILNTAAHFGPEAASLSDWKYGAGDGDRTRDIQLGKLAFYPARKPYVADGKQVPRCPLTGTALQLLRSSAYSVIVALP